MQPEPRTCVIVHDALKNGESIVFSIYFQNTFRLFFSQKIEWMLSFEHLT